MDKIDRFLRVSDSNVDSIAGERNKRQVLALLEWFKRSVEYEHFLTANKLKYNIKKGEVYEIDFGRNVGCELNERHYAVVMHNSQVDAQNILVVPLTTKVHYSYGNAIDLGYLEGINTQDRSYARVSQMRTVDKARIYLRPIMNVSEGRGGPKVFGPVTKVTKDQYIAIIKGFNDLINTL